MKLNRDLLLDLLEHFVKLLPEHVEVYSMRLDLPYEKKDIQFHVILLEEAGYIAFKKAEKGYESTVGDKILHVTLKGYEYLEKLQAEIGELRKYTRA